MSTPSVPGAIPGLEFLRRGKVRDLYRLGDFLLLLVATDRVSAFDVVLPNQLPGKGKLLTAISAFWFQKFEHRARHHLVTCDVDRIDRLNAAQREALRGRTMAVRPLEVVPYEFVVRGYLSGSGWKSYQETGSICGVPLPRGLRESERLPEPIFTPTTKAEKDEPVTLAEMEAQLGSDTARKLAELSLALYREGAAYALEKGVIVADTKFEFALENGEPVLIDEVLTPDSSRYWPLDEYAIGGSPPSYDKQIVRNWLLASGWNKKAPGPVLPEEIVKQTLARYAQLFEVLTGRKASEILGGERDTAR
ncbi:MAG: phosphoribosylaminoimidazolesuccinocarboxamide synthase [Planctomycetes bacterium]|nr:phosphoribosylaminoimidazolesuccinocarboxamide synthase [Planctomycetota bacterium]